MQRPYYTHVERVPLHILLSPFSVSSRKETPQLRYDDESMLKAVHNIPSETYDLFIFRRHIIRQDFPDPVSNQKRFQVGRGIAGLLM